MISDECISFRYDTSATLFSVEHENSDINKSYSGWWMRPERAKFKVAVTFQPAEGRQGKGPRLGGPRRAQIMKASGPLCLCNEVAVILSTV